MTDVNSVIMIIFAHPRSASSQAAPPPARRRVPCGPPRVLGNHGPGRPSGALRSSGMGMWVRRAGFRVCVVNGWCDHEVQAKSSLHINNRQSNVGSGSQLGRTGVNGDARWGRGIHDMRRQFHVISAYIRALGERLDLVRQSIPDLTLTHPFTIWAFLLTAKQDTVKTGNRI